MNTWYHETIFRNERGFQPGYFATSTALHVALVVAALAYSALMPISKMPELVQVEFISNAGASGALAPLESPSVTEAQAKTEPPKISSTAEDTVAIPEAKVPTKRSSKQNSPKPARSHAHHSPKATPTAKRQALPIVTSQNSEVEAPILEDQELEQSLQAPVKVVAKPLDERALTDDFDKVDQETKQKVAALTDDINQSTHSAFEESNEQLEAVKEQQKEEERQMAQAIAEQKKHDQEKLAVLAAERAKQQEAAERAAAAAKAAREVELARANAAKQMGNGGTGQVRTLEELRQIPGNRRPQYDAPDRLAGRQGEVSFLAYISREGHPIQFKMVKSTGHRTLDYKTLKAIREWKFYPGQEGWVEIPFKWDLKGGPQEMPATLRRKISQN